VRSAIAASKSGGLLWIASRIGEVIDDGPLARRRLAGSHAVFELLPVFLDTRAGEQLDHRPGTPGYVRAQALADGREREGPILLLREHPRAGQQAQDAVQGRGVGRGDLGELARFPRAVPQQVGNAERRGQMEDVRKVVGRRHLVEEDLRREHGWYDLLLGCHVVLRERLFDLLPRESTHDAVSCPALARAGLG